MTWLCAWVGALRGLWWRESWTVVSCAAEWEPCDCCMVCQLYESNLMQTDLVTWGKPCLLPASLA